MEFGPVFWALAALAVVAAAAYGALLLDRPRTWLRALVKTLFMGALSAALIIADVPAPLVIAAIASAFGDFFLAFDKKWLLPLGILSFLIAQLLYLIIFLALWFFSGDNSPLWPRYLAMGAIVVSSLGFLVWMAPKLRWMALAVVPYAIAITGMAVAAMWLPWAGWPAMLGAVLFLASDLVLATELFRLAPDAPARRITSPFVWWSYAAAQLLIVWGVIQVALT
ncbi:MAG: lysoplasmalogenase [Hyphomonadaceae bacterium]|nr:lysoplasmalogenase [Hyphomonadaceae bacterium]